MTVTGQGKSGADLLRFVIHFSSVNCPWMWDFWNLQVLLWPHPYLLRTVFQEKQLWRYLHCNISPSSVLACLIAPHLHAIPRKSMNRQHFSHHDSSGCPSFITCSFILTNMLWELIGRYMVILLYVHMKINTYVRKTVHLCTLCLVYFPSSPRCVLPTGVHGHTVNCV